MFKVKVFFLIYDDKSKSLICKVFIKADIVCTSAKARVEMEFWNFGYLRWEGGCPMKGVILCWRRSAGQFILHLFSPFWNATFQNFKKFWSVAPSFSIFTFSNLRYMQGCRYILTLTVNLNFFVQGAVSFHTSVVTHNQKNPWNCFLFYPFGALRGPFVPSSQ